MYAIITALVKFMDVLCMCSPANGQCICISCDMGDVGQLAEQGPETSKDQKGRHGKPRMRNVMLNVTATKLNPTFDGKMMRTGQNQNMTLMSMYYTVYVSL